MVTGNSVIAFQGYRSLPSDHSDSEVLMEGPSNTLVEEMAAMKMQLQQLASNNAMLKKAWADACKKETDQTYAKTWEETAKPETQDPIGRVVALLETAKQEDPEEHYISLLEAQRAAGRATLSTYAELSKAVSAYKKKYQSFCSTL